MSIEDELDRLDALMKDLENRGLANTEDYDKLSDEWQALSFDWVTQNILEAEDGVL